MKNEEKNIPSEETKMGNITVSEDVIAAVVKNAVLEIEGVKGIAGTESEQKVLFLKIRKESPNGGIKVDIKDQAVASVEIPVILKYGTNVIDVSKCIQEKVREAIIADVGMEAGNIDVTVEQISD